MHSGLRILLFVVFLPSLTPDSIFYEDTLLSHTYGGTRRMGRNIRPHDDIRIYANS
jgi:hypothetical protein